MKDLNIGKKSKIEIEWLVKPIDFSHEKQNNIAAKFAKKHGISKELVNVIPKYIVVNSKGETLGLTTEIVENIQDPVFQQKLFKEYIDENEITNYDFDTILNIDNQINSLIDFDKFEKFRRYEIKWLKWSNFLSYGDNNYFDFTTLDGLVLLNSQPANQGGKSTFAYDLLHFLLYGKTSKTNTLAQIFHKHRPDETQVLVEGCVVIDNEEYIIRRTLTRPQLKKRTAKSSITQKLEYFKIVGNQEVLLDDCEENQEGTNGTQTNKIIKEAIGNERDFDLVISADSDNLKSLISLKDTERGRLLSKWIGLLPLEDKDKIARDKFNKEITPSLMSSKYNREMLLSEITELEGVNKTQEQKNAENKKNLTISLKKIEGFEQERETLLTSKKNIDSKLLTVDVNTIEVRLKQIKKDGSAKKDEKATKENELKVLENIKFSENEYKRLITEDKEKTVAISQLKNDISRIKKENEELKSSEFCPTCKRKFDGINNSNKISENEKEIEKLIKNGIDINKRLEEIKKEIKEQENLRIKFNEKLKLELLIDKISVDIKNLAGEYREKERLLNDINANKDAIINNNKIDIAINNVNINLKTEQNYKDNLLKENERLIAIIENNNKLILERKKIITTIEKEEKLIRNWKIYLEMIGKNGISKIVLRKTLPIINVELKRLLSGVCDFDVEVDIDNSNDVAFYLVHNNIQCLLSAGSGFEQTVASLALRTVLGNISTMPRPNFLCLDEVLGGVAKENYDNVRSLYEKIVKNYSFILHITHNVDIMDWHSKIITVKRIGDVSSISTTA